MELEPIRPKAIVEELAHHQSQIEWHEEKIAYHIKRAKACENILRMTNTIFVPDEVWANGRADKSE